MTASDSDRAHLDAHGLIWLLEIGVDDDTIGATIVYLDAREEGVEATVPDVSAVELINRGGRAVSRRVRLDATWRSFGAIDGGVFGYRTLTFAGEKQVLFSDKVDWNRETGLSVRQTASGRIELRGAKVPRPAGVAAPRLNVLGPARRPGILGRLLNVWRR